MENENKYGDKKSEIVFSKKFRAGKRRTYFFDVKTTRTNDYYLTITESKKKFEGDGYDRHKLFLYKEDFNRFLDSMTEAINHIKTQLMPEYDFDEFARKQEEYEKQRAENMNNPPAPDTSDAPSTNESPKSTNENDDDMKW